MDIRNGNRIALWYSFFRRLLRISQMKIANRIPRVVFKKMNATLYKIVFLVMTAASSDANRNSKFFSPIQSLAKIPLEKSTFLNAMIIPNIGI